MRSLQNTNTRILTTVSAPLPHPFMPRDIWCPIERYYEANVLKHDAMKNRIQCRSSIIEDFLMISLNDLKSIAISCIDFPCSSTESCIPKTLKSLQSKSDVSKLSASIGGYLVKRRIGAGGYGVVHLSSNSPTGEIAIKVDPQISSVVWEAEVHRIVSVHRLCLVLLTGKSIYRSVHLSIAHLMISLLLTEGTLSNLWNLFYTR